MFHKKTTYHCFSDLSHSLILGLVFFFLVHPAFGQENDLLKKANTLKYYNPDEAIKIGEYQLKSAEKHSYKALELQMMADAYLIKGDYPKALNTVFEAGQLHPKKTKSIIKTNLLKTRLLWDLFLDDQAKRYLQNAEKLVDGLETEKEKTAARIGISLEKLRLDFTKKTKPKSLATVDSLTKSFTSKNLSNEELWLEITFAKVWVLGHLSKSAASVSYFKKALAALARKPDPNFYAETLLKNGLGELLIKQKRYKTATDTLLKALKAAKKIDNPFLLRTINQNLAVAALALNDKNAHKTYNQAFVVLSNEVEKLEQEAVNSAYNLINNEQQEALSSKKGDLAGYRNTAVVVFIVIVVVCFGFWLKFYLKKKRYKEILNYLEVGKNISANLKLKPKSKGKVKRIVIPEEKEKAILKKLKRFEKSTKFTSNDMSLALLAGQLDTNTKYLSEIINRHYHDNFNTYINKLRIKFVIEKLKTDPNFMHYKISFLAEKSGFSTHSSFATVFKSIVGMTPATFINLLKKDRETDEKK